MTRVLMLGWEYPPHVSGGLGVACAELTRALTRRGAEVLLVLPRRARRGASTHLQLFTPREVAARGLPLPRFRLAAIDSLLRPYQTRGQYRDARATAKTQPGAAADRTDLYGDSLFAEIGRFARMALAIARTESFDVIHAHDWMTFPAALAVRRASRKPLVLHVHSLESDRAGDQPNPAILAIERRGLEGADLVIAVSHHTRDRITAHYGIPPAKVVVVHNAVPRRRRRGAAAPGAASGHRRPRHTVLFLGRLTHQKGPEYFVQAAARVLSVMPDATFVMAGAGDRLSELVEQVARLRLGRRFRFAGFLGGREVEALLDEAAVYVMPSVSEPFGLAPLEAMAHDVPVIVSRDAGVSEVVRHALKVDFWNVDDMADKILAALRHPTLARTLIEGGRADVDALRWTYAAERVLDLYRELGA